MWKTIWPRVENEAIRIVYLFPKGSIWQTRYLVFPFALVVSTFTLTHGVLNPFDRIFWFIFGVSSWTLLEYILHRYILHYNAKSKVGQAIVNRLHQFHHGTPSDDSQVCMPLLLTLPIWITVWVLILAFGGNFEGAAQYVSGLALMMTIYDITHYSTHYMKPTNALLKYLKKYHMDHHFLGENRKFGVTSPFWDLVFRTR